ncbi:MAG TPA: tetratricopeptide repeat protein, partial [Candidatus Saccharimonadales bacterium]|nr:tetratricopeptide repeat protein [Candidatus Saccharimonadales bacterium]
ERPAARIVRARALAGTGQLKEALAAYAEAADSFGGTTLERYGAFCETARAQILAAAGDLQGAAAAARKGTEIDPWYAPARFWLGRLLVEAGQAHDARAVLEETEKKMESDGPPPAAFWLHVLRAEVRRGEGDLGAALSEIGKASSMPPELTSPEVLRFTEARVKEAFGDIPGAIASYRQGLEPLPRELWRDRVVTPLALYELARLEERAGKPDAARGHYRAFLAEWDRADMPVASVEDARARLKLLGG